MTLVAQSTLADGTFFHVAATGSPDGRGTQDEPWDLTTALSHPPVVQPGDVIWLAPGIYRGKFVSKLKGLTGEPITVRGVPGGRTVIDGFAALRLLAPVSARSTAVALAMESWVLPGMTLQVDAEDMLIRERGPAGVSVVRGWNGTSATEHRAAAVALARGAILTVTGADTVFRDFEVTSSDSVRATRESGSAPNEILRGTGVAVQAAATRLVNLIVHDAADGIGVSEASGGSEICGCVTYNNGWQAPDRGHGHGLYLQNRSGLLRINEVVSFNNFATGMKAFGIAGPAIGVQFAGVIAFNNGSLRDPSQAPEVNVYVGTDQIPADLIRVSDSFLFHPPGNGGTNLRLGFSTGNGAVSITGNYLAGGRSAIELVSWDAAAVQNNLFHVSKASRWDGQSLALGVSSVSGTGRILWDSNLYFDEAKPYDDGSRYTFSFDPAKNRYGGGLLSFREWQAATGFDRKSSYLEATVPPAQSFLRGNICGSEISHIVVMNWEKRDFIDVDVGGIAGPSSVLVVRDLQNYYGPPLLVSNPGQSQLRLPLNLTNVAAPAGEVPQAPKHTAPLFSVFRVERVPVRISPGQAASSDRGTTGRWR